MWDHSALRRQHREERKENGMCEAMVLGRHPAGALRSLEDPGCSTLENKWLSTYISQTCTHHMVLQSQAYNLPWRHESQLTEKSAPTVLHFKD
jgi:hypothetical protein